MTLTKIQQILVDSIKESLSLKVEDVAKLSAPDIMKTLSGLHIVMGALEDALRRIQSGEEDFGESVNIEQLESDLITIEELFEDLKADETIQNKLAAV